MKTICARACSLLYSSGSGGFPIWRMYCTVAERVFRIRESQTRFANRKFEFPNRKCDSQIAICRSPFANVFHYSQIANRYSQMCFVFVIRNSQIAIRKSQIANVFRYANVFRNSQIAIHKSQMRFAIRKFQFQNCKRNLRIVIRECVSLFK